MAIHAGMITAEFGRIVEEWIATARHPQTDTCTERCDMNPIGICGNVRALYPGYRLSHEDH